MVYVALEFTIRYTKGQTGLLVGFIREFPFITGQAKTFEELESQLIHDVGIYFQTFNKEKVLFKYGKNVNTGLNLYGEKPPPLEIEQPELGEGWLQKSIILSNKTRTS